ncbi:hypothetical protein [Azospirillum sp.]|uniref:hypothetical protein n=1 Tax=Azospirillum sp. TaxID=34012 RepID=UPI002D634B54|nr:hypothetical protein [Azospirillum sp.]HYF86173.1 hypothetical protein [Azospirillum sp.]
MTIADVWDRHPRDRSRHPHWSFLLLDQLDFRRLEAFAEDNQQVLVIDVERDGSGHMRVTVGCSSPEVQARLEDAWG